MVRPSTTHAIKALEEADALRIKLRGNTAYFRKEMTQAEFEIKPGFHPIVPILIGDARIAQDMAKNCLGEGVYVVGFSYPVVPRGQTRIRVQISVAHTMEHFGKTIKVFRKVGRKYGIIP